MEANAVVVSRSFNAEVAARLASLETRCRPVRQDTLPLWNRWPPLGSFIVFHVLRWVSRVGAWLPRRPQRVQALGGRDGAGRRAHQRTPPLR
ncbi:hypothetical protein D9M68_961090 [compost metagenome]